MAKTWAAFEQQLGSTLEIVGPMPNGWKPSSLPVIFVDGGQRWRPESAPLSFSIGDGDSFTPAPPDLLLATEKDVSDFGVTLGRLPAGIQDVFLHGFDGGRFDHELANLGEIHAFLKARRAPCRVHFESRGMALSAGHWSLEINGPFSVFTLEPAPVSIEGACKYKLTPKTRLAPLSSHGLSNEGFGDVRIDGGGPVFVLAENPLR